MAQYSKLTPKAYTCALPAQPKSNAKVLLGYGLVANADRNFTVAHALGIARNAERRLKARRKMYRSQKYSTRPLGSIDICKKCGKEYVVKAGLQVYCPECAENAVREKVNAHKRQYMIDNKDKYAPRRAEMRSNGWVCAVCGKVFDTDSPTVTCSEECAKKLKKIWQDRVDINRGKRLLPPGETYESRLPKSGVVGITWHRQRRKWQVKHKNTYLGLYASLDEAKKALDKYQKGANIE